MIKTVEDINLEVNPSPVVLQGDEVTIDITGTFPPSTCQEGDGCGHSVLVWEGGEAAFETANYQGEDAAGNGTVVSWENGKSFSYTAKVPYEAAMKDNAKLELRMSAPKETNR